MANERMVYLNGELVPDSQAKISIHDLGFLMGDAVFDTTRTFGGVIFKLQQHLERFYRSLAYMRIDPGMTQAEMADCTMQVLQANLPLIGEQEDYWITQRVTRGMRVYDDPGASLTPTVLIECQPLPFAGITLSPTPTAIIALGVNGGAYAIEIIRGGVQSINKGQVEAGQDNTIYLRMRNRGQHELQHDQQRHHGKKSHERIVVASSMGRCRL